MVITEETKDQVVALYQSGLGCTTVAKMLGIGETTVLRILKQRTVGMRRGSEARRSYVLDEDYFDHIDSEDKAYFLGLLYADGNNYMKKFHAITLNLQEEDAYLVERFAAMVYGGLKKPRIVVSKTPRHKNQARIVIYNQHMSQRLAELGCVPRKSLVLEFPKTISDNLIPHMIRGYFDGDGSIYLSNRNRYGIQIVSSVGFIHGLDGYLRISGGLSNATVAPHKNKVSSVLVINAKQDIFKFVHIIYQDASLDYLMHRKHEKCMEFLSQYSQANARWSQEEKQTLEDNITLPTRKLKALLNRSTDSIERKKARLLGKAY
jgi:hypothetical protein